MSQSHFNGTKSYPVVQRLTRSFSVTVNQADRQAVITRPEPYLSGFSPGEWADALRMVAENQLANGLRSVITWPAMNDIEWCTVLEKAGFVRTGLFMKRAAIGEDQDIALKTLDDKRLADFLEQHAAKTAEATAMHRQIERDDVIGHVMDDYRTRFSNGSIASSEAILSIVDRPASRAVGLIWLSFHTEGDSPTAFIEEIQIEPAYRRKGYARRCIRSLGSMSLARPIDVISLFVQPENIPAYLLYQSLGFEPGRSEYLYRNHEHRHATKS
ncbi:MAG: GNAT family N-acetyltransferase [Phycisphaeraceae bacterium]|nr:GNAT family N-acetyltransferase [Phycisphaeraceae bacterium]